MKNIKLLTSLITFVIVCAYIAILAKYQKSLDINAIPWHDGSHHFTLAANLFSHMRAGDYSNWLEAARNSPELLFAYTIFNFAFALLGGVKHEAIPLVYGFFFVLLVVIYSISLRSKDRSVKTLLFTTLFILSGLYTTAAGGAFDTRIDLLSASAGALSLVLVVNRKFYFAILFFLLAAFLKGAAFFLILPMLALGIFIEYFKEKIEVKWNLKFALQSISLAIPFLIFVKVLLASVLSYNLMKTGGSNLESRMEIFISNLNQYLIGGFSYYFTALRENSKTVYMYGGVLILFAASVFLKNKKLILSGVFVFLSLIYSYLLMTMSPLKSTVLIIWFLPCLMIALVFLTDFIYQTKNKEYLITILFLLSIIVLYKIPQKYKIPEDYLQAARSNIQKQTGEIAIKLDQKFENRFVKGAVFVNFLSAHGVISYNYDTYTSLIHKRVKSAKLDLAGWELATYSKEWKAEIEKYRDYELILLVLQEEPMGIPAENVPQKFGREIYLELEKSIQKNPNCFEKVADTIDLPHIKKRDAYFFSNTLDCKSILFP
jgi:hypothetical protein